MKINLNNFKIYFLVINLYIVIFFILTYPLIINFSQSILGEVNSDAPIFYWNAWQLSKQINNFDFSFLTNFLLYPNTNSLLLHSYTPINSLVIIFLNTFFQNLTFSFNLSFLFFCVLCAFLTYKFFYWKVSNHYIAFLVGIFFAFQPLWSLYTLFGTQNILSFWFLPASFCLYELFIRNKKNIYLVLTGIIISLSFYNDVYIFAFCCTALILYSVYIILIQKKIFLKNLLLQLGLIFSSFIITSFYKILLIIQQNNYFKHIPRPSIADVDFYHADIINLLRPASFHALWSNWSTWFNNSSLTNGNSFIGFTFIIILLFALVIKIKNNIKLQKHFSFWIICYLLILLVSFGPYLHLFGIATHLPMPYYLLIKLFPVFSNLRVPLRWLILSYFFLAGIFSCFLQIIFSKNQKKYYWLLTAIISFGLIMDVAYIPRQLISTSNKDLSIFNGVKEGTVINLPIAISSGYQATPEDTKMDLLYQTIHQQPIAGGHLSRLPDELFNEFNNEPVTKYFINCQNQLPSPEDMDQYNVQNFKAKYKVKNIVINKELFTNKNNLEELNYYIINTFSFKKKSENNNFVLYQDSRPSPPSLLLK